MSFYTYLWLRENGTPYYVGKGTGNRAYEKGNHRLRAPADSSHIIVLHWGTELEALASEVRLIAMFGRKDLKGWLGCLRNLTDGGEGVSGYHHTEECKQLTGSKVSKALKARVNAGLNVGYPRGVANPGQSARMLGKAFAAGKRSKPAWNKGLKMPGVSAKMMGNRNSVGQIPWNKAVRLQCES